MLENELNNAPELTNDVSEVTPQTNQERTPVAAPEITVDNLKTGKIDFYSLPREQRNNLTQQMYDSLPNDEAREAYMMGWRPKEMFRGKYKDGTDKSWENYDTFLHNVETKAPIRNERMKEMAKEKKELQDRIDKMMEMNKMKLERDLMIDEVSVDREMKEAEEYGDVPKFRAALDKKNNLEREKLRLKSFEEPPVAPTPPVQAIPQEAIEWGERNREIVSNPQMLRYAEKIDEAYAITHPHLSLRDRLVMVEERVKSEPTFSHHFPIQRTTPAVDSARNSASFGSKPRTLGFNDLPKAERDQAERMIKDGYYKNKEEVMKYCYPQK